MSDRTVTRHPSGEVIVFGDIQPGDVVSFRDLPNRVFIATSSPYMNEAGILTIKVEERLP